MRIIFFVLLIIFTIPLKPVYAQTFFPRVGITVSTIAYDPQVQGEKMRPSSSVSIGLGGEVHLSKMFDLYIECDYLSRNFRLEVDNIRPKSAFHYAQKVQHRYIDVPVMVRAYFGESRRFYVNVGGYVGFGLGGFNNVEWGFYDPSDPDVEFDEGRGVIKYESDPVWDPEDDLYYSRKVDLGAVAGGGIMLAKFMVVDFRYGMGLVDIDDNNGGFKNRVFQVALSVPLALNPIE